MSSTQRSNTVKVYNLWRLVRRPVRCQDSINDQPVGGMFKTSSMKSIKIQEYFIEKSIQRARDFPMAVFSRQPLSRLTFLKMVRLQTLLSDLKMIPVFTDNI